jgi:hypothetical protein
LASGNEKKHALEILQSAANQIQDLDFLTKLGGGNANNGLTKLGNIIKHYTGKCSTCGNLGYEDLPINPSEYLEAVYSYTKKFGDRNIQGFDVPSFLNQPYSQVGFLHGMRYMNSFTFDPEKVESIDFNFGDDGFCPNCKFDVKFKNTFSANVAQDITLTFVEFKSYLNATNIQVPQFLSYISRIKTFQQLNYVFDKNKLSTQSAQSQMQTFFKSNKQAIFNAMNADLRLRVGVENVSDLTDTKVAEIVNSFVF